MIKATVIGCIDDTIICWTSDNHVYFVEENQCFKNSEEYIRNENPKYGDLVYFDEWFWSGSGKKLQKILGT